MPGLHSVCRMFHLGRQLHRLSLKKSLEHISQRSIGTQQEAVSVRSPQVVGPPRILQAVPQTSYLLREKLEKEYVCPSRLSVHRPSLVILDTSVSSQTALDCPTLPQHVRDITVPEARTQVISDPASHNAPVKEARNILKIRRRKMNRHLLKKFRKRMLFTHRKQKLQKRKKKEKIFQARLNAITKKATDFDAEAFIKEELEEARRGGFYIQIMSSKN